MTLWGCPSKSLVDVEQHTTIKPRFHKYHSVPHFPAFHHCFLLFILLCTSITFVISIVKMLFSKISVAAGVVAVSQAAVIGLPPIPIIGGGGISISIPNILPTPTKAPSTTSTAVSTTKSASATSTPGSSILDPLLHFVPNTLTDAASILQGKLNAKTSSPTSNVKGFKFDRFVQIWLENTDFASAMADRKFSTFSDGYSD